VLKLLYDFTSGSATTAHATMKIAEIESLLWCNFRNCFKII